MDTGFCIGLMKARLNFFHGEMDTDETTELNPGQSLVFAPGSINLTTMPQPPIHGSLECFPCDHMKGVHFHWQQFLFSKDWFEE